jgi:hypothetical protein
MVMVENGEEGTLGDDGGEDEEALAIVHSGGGEPLVDPRGIFGGEVPAEDDVFRPREEIGAVLLGEFDEEEGLGVYAHG